MNIPFLLGAFKRNGTTEVQTVNWLVEKDPTSQANPVKLVCRPGLEEFKTVGTAPIRGLFQKQGLFDDAALILADTTLYKLSAAGVATDFTGTVPGDERVDMDAGLDADYYSVVRVATGTALYKADSNTGAVVAEDFPSAGGAGATSVGFLAGYWLASEAGSDAVYYQIPASTTWSALQFASAEYAPDKIVAIRVFGELAALLGETTAEFWYATGDSGSPLEPAGGLKFDLGCRARDAAVNCNGTLIWVDHLCGVRLSDGGEPRLISDHGLAEQIRRTAASDLRASFFVKDQHPCYVLTLGASATWIYDLVSEAWTRATSDGYAYWRAHLFCNIGDTVLAADVLSNQVWRLDPDRMKDGSDTFTRYCMAKWEVKEGQAAVGNLVLDCELGDGPRTGQGSDPLIGLQICRDEHTLGPIKYKSLGETGKYTVSPKWTGLGILKPPFGGYFLFQLSDPVCRRISGLRANVAS